MRDARRTRMKRTLGLVLPFVAFLSARASAADLADAQKLFNTGKYSECIAACNEATQGRQLDEGWWILKIRSELTTGKYARALETCETAVDRFETSARVRLLAYDVYRLTN